MADKQLVKVPTIAELYENNLEEAFKSEQFNLLLNHEPKKEWVKVHPFIKDYKYIPIDKVEFLLRKLFKRYRIEITGQGTAFNGVWVTTRVHYWNPIINDWDFHDGIGACQMQTKAGTSASDLININNGALSMAFPIAKTISIKDACDHFGKLFGCDLNRKDTLPFQVDESLAKEPESKLQERIKLMISDCQTLEDLEMLQETYPEIDIKLYEAQKAKINASK